MTVRKYLAVLVLALVFTPAQAGFFTGNDLIPMMREWETSNRGGNFDVYQASVYHGYVAGVFDTLYNQGKVCALEKRTGRSTLLWLNTSMKILRSGLALRIN